MSSLFQPLQLRDVKLKNRVAVSPMCEYSARDGRPNEWHLVHLGSRAIGGAALVLTEATAVSPEGRITPYDTGIYDEATQEAWAPIVDFVHRHDSVAGIQLAHAGRKASTEAPWNGGKLLRPGDGGWDPIFAPTSEPFMEGYGTPTVMNEHDIRHVSRSFEDAAKRSLEIGFKVAEIHAAHGYLLHQFMSPLTNSRTDRYGGSFENRTRIVREVVQSVRSAWPESLPLVLRISASDWSDGGWNIQDSVDLAKQVGPLGVDLIDCSSGGNIPAPKIPVGPGYQVPFAEQIRRESGIATGAVGMITDPHQAEEIVASGKADIVLLARELLRDPYWPRRAAEALGEKLAPPVQYGRAWG